MTGVFEDTHASLSQWSTGPLLGPRIEDCSINLAGGISLDLIQVSSREVTGHREVYPIEFPPSTII